MKLDKLINALIKIRDNEEDAEVNILNDYAESEIIDVVVQKGINGALVILIPED